MTPNQRNQLRQMRDKGYPLDARTRKSLIKFGHLSEDGTILTDPDHFDALSVSEKIIRLSKDHTTRQISERLGIRIGNVLSFLSRAGLPSFRPPSSARNQLRKARLRIGDPNEVPSEIAEKIVRHAVAKRITFIAAAAQIIAEHRTP